MCSAATNASLEFDNSSLYKGMSSKCKHVGARLYCRS